MQHDDLLLGELRRAGGLPTLIVRMYIGDFLLKEIMSRDDFRNGVVAGQWNFAVILQRVFFI